MLLACRLTIIIYCLSGWFSLVWGADGDDYLQQIEEEAKRQAIQPKTTKPVAPVQFDSRVVPRIREVADRLSLGLTQQAFETALRDQFIGTYNFYKKLSRKNRQRIFEFYQQNNQVGAIRKETLRLLLGS